MGNPIEEAALDVLFRYARTHNGWQGKPVGEDLLRDVWNLARMGPTSANCSPARIVFVSSKEAKEKLRPCLIEGNVDKTMAAPVTAIIGYDLEFYERLPELFPHTDARSWFVGKEFPYSDNGVPKRQPAGSVFYTRGARIGSGLRTHVGVR